MKDLLRQQLEFSRVHFTWKLLASIVVFLLLSVAINYQFPWYDEYVFRNTDKIEKGILNALMLVFPFLVICGLISLITGQRHWWGNGGFWLRILGFFGIWGVSYYWEPLAFLEAGYRGHDFVYMARTMGKLESMINVVLPVALVYFFFERDSYKSVYGLRSAHWDWRPYLILFLILVVIIGVGSFFNDLQAYYPRYLKTNGTQIAADRGIDEWILVSIYELAYGSNFISIELFFRGALVLAFSRYLGGYAVLAMVGSYIFLHFGKPMTETLSSAVGGYVLGVIALHSRNIWGGVVLHVGVAWLMELFGWLQRIWD